MPFKLDPENLDQVISNTNLAQGLSDELLDEIGDQVVKDFDLDLNSRREWENQYDEWIKLAIQKIDPKTYPWTGAANIKYPLVATSAMQFAARAYPTLVSGTKVVKARVIGKDPLGEKMKRAERISEHMSYQVLEEMDGWEEAMDRGCFILPIIGCVFKKVWFDPNSGTNKSDLVLPKDLVINYWARSLEDAETKTHILYMSRNTVKEKQLAGLYLEDFDIKQAQRKEIITETRGKEYSGQTPPGNDETAPLTILEQHRWLDLDEDDLKEPYIVTVEYSTKKVLRITARFEMDGVKREGDKIIKFTPEEYFIKFPFIPNPDGGFYDLGFGALLGPLNETVNTVINQLLDSGSLSILQAGFIAKGAFKNQKGNYQFTPGEWKTVNFVGDDLRKSILPLPVQEPSNVLFSLLGTIVESGEKLASVAEIFVGKMPGQNTPATTTMATIEQGMKVFTAIYKRIYRALTKEFKRLYRLNKIYLKPEDQFSIVDSTEVVDISISDYQGDDTDVKPAADPTAVSEMLRLEKARALLELLPLGLNPQEVVKRVLEAEDQPEIEKLMPQGLQPPPDPKAQELQLKMEMEKAKMELKVQEMQMKMQIEQQMGKFDIMMKQIELQLKAMEMNLKAEGAQRQAMIDSQVAEQDMQIQQRQGQQKMELGEQQFQMKQRQMKQQEKEGAKKKPNDNKE